MLDQLRRTDLALRAGIKLLGLGFMVIAGCGESSGSTSVTLSGRATELLTASSAVGPPIAGVEVCQFASNNCALTNENGDYELRVLRNRELEMSYVKEGFGSVLVARQSGVDDLIGDVILATDAALMQLASELDTPYPQIGSGSLSMTVYRGPISDDVTIPGVRFALTGSNGRSFYLDDAWVPRTSLTETQSLGRGGYVELAPVTVSVQLYGAAVNCGSEESWLAAGANTFRLPVRVGFWTQSRVSCE